MTTGTETEARPRGRDRERGDRPPRERPAEPTVDSIIDSGCAQLKDAAPDIAQLAKDTLKSFGLENNSENRGLLSGYLSTLNEFATAFKNFAAELQRYTGVFSVSHQALDSMAEKLEAKQTLLNKALEKLTSERGIGSSAEAQQILELCKNKSDDKAKTAADFLKDLNDEREARRYEGKHFRDHPELSKLFGPDESSGPIVHSKTITTSFGEMTLSLYKEDGFAYAKITGGRNARGGESEVVLKLDAERVTSNASNPKSLLLNDQIESRIEDRLVKLLSEWDAKCTGSASDGDRLAQNSGHALLSSEVGMAIARTGIIIDTLKNGEFHKVNLAFWNLSGVKLENFNITECQAHGLNLSRAIVADGCKISGNTMPNADCSYIKFLKPASGSSNSEFCGNDMRGQRGSIAFADFGSTSCRNNNWTGVNMTSIRADSLDNPLASEKGGVWVIGDKARARAAFVDQFKGTKYTPGAADGHVATAFNINSGLCKPKEFEAITKDFSQSDLMKAASESMYGKHGLIQLHDAKFDPSAAPGMDPLVLRKIYREGTRMVVSSLDDPRVQSEAHFENNHHKAYFGAGAEPEFMGNLEAFYRLQAELLKNRRRPTANQLMNGLTRRAEDQVRVVGEDVAP